MAKKSSGLLWVDLEMTGLDEFTDHILEVAAVVTDWAFVSKEEYSTVIYQPPAVVDAMNEWSHEHHGKSGLTEKIPAGENLFKAEEKIIAMLDAHFMKDERVLLAGNSIHNDRKFIDRYMKRLAKRLHYRMLDVSSFKEVFRNRYSYYVEKKNAHRAVGDIEESISELKAYLSHCNLENTRGPNAAPESEG